MIVFLVQMSKDVEAINKVIDNNQAYLKCT